MPPYLTAASYLSIGRTATLPPNHAATTLDGMNITCPQCGTRYNLTAAQIGPQGRTLKCAKCQHQWFVEPLQDDHHPAADPDVPPPLPPQNNIGLDELAYVGQNPAWWRKFGRSLMLWLLLAILLLGGALAYTLWLLMESAEDTDPSEPAPITSPQPQNLVISDITRDIQEDGLLVILRFSGTITNTGDTQQRLPELRLQLLDAKGIELDFWPAETAKPALDAGESTRWTARFLNPPLERIANWRAFFKTDTPATDGDTVPTLTPATVEETTSSPTTPPPDEVR